MEVNGNGLGKVRERGRLLAHGFFMLNSCWCKGDCAIRRLTQTYSVFCWNNQIRSSQSQKNNNNNPRSLQRMRNAAQKCNQNLLRVLCFNGILNVAYGTAHHSVPSLVRPLFLRQWLVTSKIHRLQGFFMRCRGVWYNIALKREAAVIFETLLKVQDKQC